MAGTIYAKLECLSNPGTAAPEMPTSQEYFKGLYDFLVYLESQGVVTLRARFAGASAAAGDTDYQDGTNPFRTNAWFLYEWRTATTTPANPSYAGTRTWPWYLLVQFARGDQGIFGASGIGNPVLISGTNLSAGDGAVAVSAAIGVGGDQNPWNGTLGTYGNSASFGNQTKGDPVWKVPTGGTDVYAFPRSNNSGGSHATSRQNMSELYWVSTSAQTRYHFIADHDSLLILTDETNSGVYQMHYSGVYTPRSGLSQPYPFIQLTSTFPFVTTQYGTTAGTGVNQGGVASTGQSTGVKAYVLSRMDEAFTAQPNTMFPTPTYDEMPLYVGLNDFYQGYLGTIDFFKECYGVATQDTNTAGTKIVIGNTTVNSIKIIVPWKAGVTPGSGTTRAGTTVTLP